MLIASIRDFAFINLVVNVPDSLAHMLSNSWNKEIFVGTTISAAPVGVGARTSAAKSISIQSGSCPTPDISGMRLAAAARTTTSSENGNRSSNAPPPRATIITSTLLAVLKYSIPAATSAAAVVP